MARQLEATFDAQLDIIAAALTTMYDDTVLTGMAVDLADPRHPLRKYEDLLQFDAGTGVYTTNVTALAVAYADDRPTISQADKDDKWTDAPV